MTRRVGDDPASPERAFGRSLRAEGDRLRGLLVRHATLFRRALCLLGVLSLGGFIGGLSFVRDRTGAVLGAKLSWLQKTPVDDFFLPGLFLLGVYGIGSLLLMVGLAWRWSPGPVRRMDAGLGHH